jgi:hypothetical protein
MDSARPPAMARATGDDAADAVDAEDDGRLLDIDFRLAGVVKGLQALFVIDISVTETAPVACLCAATLGLPVIAQNLQSVR